jgi:protein-S-isoprenylcysteine O-methyltransferase Ste14
MPTSRDNPGVIAPPPLLYLGALALGLALDILGRRVRTGLPGAVRNGLALVLLASAGALVASALGRFRRAGTHVEPWRPSTALVTSGVYAFTRNPMYVSMALIYLAVALAADSVLALLLLVPLLAVIRYGVIAREERYLAAKFGDEYRNYLDRVRRWL